jgi:two-component system KDP operon response regulator KdpE
MSKKEEILIIDDEPQIRKLLEINLESNGYIVSQAETGKLGIQLTANHPPDLILLDIGLPDMSGQDVLKEIRQWYQKSIIILSAIDQENEIVQALDNGATDYVCKPFRTNELLARIRSAILRNSTNDNNNNLIFNDLEIDFYSRIVKKSDDIIKLTITEYKLLCLLAKNHGRVLTHQYILKEIWGIGHQNETQYLRVFIGTLRKKIEINPNKPTHIITESAVGYRFV